MFHRPMGCTYAPTVCDSSTGLGAHFWSEVSFGEGCWALGRLLCPTRATFLPFPALGAG